MRCALHEPFLDPAVVLPWAALMSLMHMTIPAPENLAKGEVLGQCLVEGCVENAHAEHDKET